MIIRLSLRYFLLNQKRTIKGSQIVAIGFIAIFSTTTLIGSFSDEISIVTSKLNKTDVNYKIQISKEDIFSNNQIAQLKTLYKEERGITYLNFENSEFGYFSSSEYSDIEIPIHFTNLTRLIEKVQLRDVEINNNEISLLMTSDIKIPLNLQIGQIYFITSSNFSSSAPLIEFLNPEQSVVNSGIFLDLTQSLHASENINVAYIEFAQNTNVPRLLKMINDIKGLNVELVRGEDKFLALSAENVANTLFVLQLAISILVFLSILNLMNIIILESRYDIRVLLSIGYSRFSVWLMFVIIGTLIGLIGALFTLIISIIIMTAIISLLAVFSFPFLTLGIGLAQILILFVNAILITILSSIIPSYQGVNSLK